MFDRIVSDACIELFRAFRVQIRLSSSSSLNPEQDGAASSTRLPAGAPSDPMTRTAALVTFAGHDLRGSLLLVTSFDVAASCVPGEGRRLSPGVPADWTLVRDCTKELANQLLGRIKNRLRTEGLTFEARTPTVVTGNAVASMIDSRPGSPLRFSGAGGGAVMVWFDADVAPEHRSLTPHRFPRTALPEGDILLSPESSRTAPESGRLSPESGRLSPESGRLRRRVLVIDDSIIVRQQVGATLRQAGYEVVEAATGAEGLQIIESGEPLGMILCDVNMPVLGGLALLEALSRRGLAQLRPFVMMTSEAQPEAVARARELGARGWMVKPVKPEALIGAVKKLLG